MSVVMQPQAWVRVDLTPVSTSPTLWQASTRPMADPPAYYDGFKQPLVESFQDAERALSDIRGGFEVSTFSFVVNDAAGFWRGLLNDPDTQYLTSSDVTFYLVSEVGRHALVEPRTAFRGQLEKPAPLPGKKCRLSAQSRVGTRYGPVDLQGPVLKRTFDTVDFPSLPRDFVATAVPFLWGELSDKGTVNADGVDISTGMVIPTYCGPIFQGSTPGTPPTAPEFLPDPPAPTYTRYGPGGTTTWTYAASVRTVNGHTRLGASVTITGLPNEGHFTGGEGNWRATPTNGVAIHLAQYATALQAEVVGADLWVKLGDASSLSQWHKVDAAGEMFNTSVNELFSGEAGYMDNGDDSHFKPSPPPPNTNTAQVTPGTPGIAANSIFYDFFCLLGHTGKITEIFGTNLAEEAAYRLIGAAEIGTTYASGANFLLGPDGNGVTITINGHDYFGFYAKGPKAEAHKSGTMLFRVNLCGWHQDNDVSLPMIDQAFFVYQDVFTQLAGGINFEGYQSGARLTIPSFTSSPTIPILQSTTFERCQEVTAAYLGNSAGSPIEEGGYLATVYFDSLETTWGQFIEGMNRTLQCDLGENHHGQLIVAIMDDMADPSDGLLLRERMEILRVENAGEVMDDEIENVVNYEFDWHPIDRVFRSGVLPLSNQDSIDGYGRRVSPSPLDLIYTRDPATALDAASRHLLHYMIGPQYPAVVCRFRRAMEAELGQQVRLQHRDFVTDTEFPLYVRRHRMSYTAGEVTLVGRDRRGTFASQAASDATIGTNSDDATAEELATLAFATNDDGTLPDGSFGSRAR